MTGFDLVVVVDWSARSRPSPARPVADAIWIGIAGPGGVECRYLRTRHAAVEALSDLFDDALARGLRVLAGFDFPFAYPAGFARAVCGSDDPLALWAELAARIEDAPDNANTRFQAAAALNRLFPGLGPFWGCPATVDLPDLPARGTARHGHGMTERRRCEMLLRGTQPCWKLFTTGSVGSQSLLGIPRLHALRQRFGDRLAVRPFQAEGAPIMLVELFPSLLAPAIAAHRGAGEIKDRAQVRVMAAALKALPPDGLEAMTREGDAAEGWILGLGHADEIAAAFSRPAG